jgi:2-dehydro-3-deoxyphosphogluconate aldolase/(4S)-4-hydroxy-2-oxoglutarate aldolase
MSDDVLARATAYGVVPVVVIDEVRQAKPLASALAAGGLPVAEVTMRTPCAAQAIAAMAETGQVLVGAGTVLTPAQVDAAVEAGAQFIVSPGLSLPVVEQCRARAVACLPGAVTATEIQAALEQGLSTLKFFPASTSGGPQAIAAFAGPFSQVAFVPTGGIGPANLADYLSLPNVRAAGGSWMVPRDALAAGNINLIADLAAEALAQAGTLLPTPHHHR